MRPSAPFTAHRRPPWALWFAWVLGLLAAQTLGLVHGTLHPESHAPAWSAAGHGHGHDHDHAQDHGHAHESDLAFGHEAGSEQCQLFDGLGQELVSPLPPLALPPLGDATAPVSRDGAVVPPAPMAGYQARGPPDPVDVSS